MVLVSAVWIERKPIASHVVDATLARDHVPARYHIADLGLGRQRLTDVVIGNPAHHDLVADWIEVSTTIGISPPPYTPPGQSLLTAGSPAGSTGESQHPAVDR